jgi:hypothetical protein
MLSILIARTLILTVFICSYNGSADRSMQQSATPMHRQRQRNFLNVRVASFRHCSSLCARVDKNQNAAGFNTFQYSLPPRAHTRRFNKREAQVRRWLCDCALQRLHVVLLTPARLVRQQLATRQRKGLHDQTFYGLSLAQRVVACLPNRSTVL